MAALASAACVHAADPPLDVSTDPQWQITMLGLSALELRRVRHDEVLIHPGDGTALSTQRAELGFDETELVFQAGQSLDHGFPG